MAKAKLYSGEDTEKQLSLHRTEEAEEPSSLFTALDYALFGEGVHYRIYHKMGAHWNQGSGTDGTFFSVWAPNAKQVSTVGDFNQWDGRQHVMKLHEDSGIWEIFIPDVGPGSIYKYEVQTNDGELLMKSDPYGFAAEVRPGNCSMVADIENYSWQDQKWIHTRENSNLNTEPVLIYEVHPGSWKRDQENNWFLSYRELANLLIPYVKRMGYSHIELMGIAEHPLDESWGYQVIGYYAATSRFGSPKDFMYFVDQCHCAGIGVLMDMVPSHFSMDAPGLSFFDGTALYEYEDPRMGEHKEWGTKVFNYEREEVRNFLIANALFWLDYYHIDGIRMDAVASMLYLDYSRAHDQWLPNYHGDNINLHAISYMKELNDSIAQYYPGVITVAEESTVWPGVSHPSCLGGLGFSMKWNMGWMNDSLRYIEKDPIERKNEHFLLSHTFSYAFAENFVLPISHDEVVYGKKSLVNKMPGDEWQQRANFRAYLTFKMAFPGKKIIFMGSEFGQWNEWNASKELDWHLLDQIEHQQLLQFSEAVNGLYSSHPGLYSSDFTAEGFEWVHDQDAERSVYAFLRKSYPSHLEAPLLFIFNFTPVPRDSYSIGVPDEGMYRKCFDSDEVLYGGAGYNQQQEVWSEPSESQGRPHRLLLDLPPLGAMAFQKK
ncbi:MAG: 1,4-alpha-glucan branching protein GlgB [SAR324 cluster bacterium]|nr:1,4-alpha-glucan branching protein GlgB [SAR324 cluster bacterium]